MASIERDQGAGFDEDNDKYSYLEDSQVTEG